MEAEYSTGTGVSELVVDSRDQVATKLAILRRPETGQEEFRHYCAEIGRLLAQTATEYVDSEADPVIVPILRAGLGLLPGVRRVFGSGQVCAAGIRRNEQTLVPEWYSDELPGDFAGRPVILLDPMCATGGSLRTVLDRVRRGHPGPVMAICLIAAPDGVRRVLDRPGTVMIAAALDEGLDDNGYIVPGLGDAGDRLFGRERSSQPPLPEGRGLGRSSSLPTQAPTGRDG